MPKELEKICLISERSKLKGYFDPIKIIKEDEQSLAILLESADVVTKLGEKSILLRDLALSIEAKNNVVTLISLDDETRAILLKVKAHFKNEIIEDKQDKVSIKIEPLFDEKDLLKKLYAQSALDIIRYVIKVIGVNKDLEPYVMLSGVFAYDFLDHFEKLPAAKIDELELPDFLFYLPLTLAVIDHPLKETTIVAHALRTTTEDEAHSRAKKRLMHLEKSIADALSDFRCQTPQPAIGTLKKNSYVADVKDEDFGHIIEECKKHIIAGDVYQIVPSRTFKRPLKNPLDCYETLRFMNPSPYMFYMHTKDWTLFGASPETFIKVNEEKTISIRPIAGTRRRGLNKEGQVDHELDAREQASLCLDEKELAEHMMLVDLARNDIATVAKANSRRVKRLMGVDRFSHVMHLVSEVEGILREDFDALSAYQASMNMGTLMGAPKIKAAQLLRKLERTKRGFYGGAIGYLDARGSMDTAIIIRSAVVKNGHAYVRAGCGVVYDSNQAFEIEETLNKAEAVLKAMEVVGAT